MTSPIVMFSPLPPRKSGIAAYTAELLPALCAQRPVVVVCEEGASPEVMAELPDCGDRLRVITPARYRAEPALHGLRTCFQIGNNRDHVFVYEAFRRRPDLLVQHDFNLHYLLDDVTLARGDVAGYERVMAEEYGSAGAELARLRQLGLFSESQKLALPVNRHLMRQARQVIVHSRWVFDRMDPAFHARTVVLPHHYSPQVASVAHLSAAQARQRLGLPPDRFLVLSLGFITPPKQIQSTLAALERLQAQGADFHFVIAGERNPAFDIDGLIQRHGLQHRVTVTGYLPESAFFEYIAAADALVNLRHPTVGESSGTLARALALGLPAIVHNFGPSSEFPDDTVLKVPLEVEQPVALAAALDSLMHNPALRQRLGQRARAHMTRHCSVEHSAQAYLRCLAPEPVPTP